MSANNLFHNNTTFVSKSVTQVCPKCGGNCSLTKDGFFIISKCEHNHILKNSIVEFEKGQFIKGSLEEIFCGLCSKKTAYNNLFYCIQCQKKLCESCKEHHMYSKIDNCIHDIIEYNNKKYYCQEHDELCLAYCSKCKKDICLQCYKAHKLHEIEEFDLNTKKIKTSLKEYKRLYEKVKDIYYNDISQLDYFFKEIDDVFRICTEKNENYGKIRTMQELNNLKSFDIEFINERLKKIINLNEEEKDILKDLGSFIQFHEEIKNPDFEKMQKEKSNKNLYIQKENELKFISKKKKEKKGYIYNIEYYNNKHMILKENIKPKEKTKLKNKKNLNTKNRIKAGIRNINISYNFNYLIYTRMSSNEYIFQSCTLLNNISEEYKYNIEKKRIINYIFNIKDNNLPKLNSADSEFNNPSKTENNILIFENICDISQYDINANLYDGINCDNNNNNKINSVEIIDEYIELIDQYLQIQDKEKNCQLEKLSLNSDVKQSKNNNKDEVNSKYFTCKEISDIQPTIRNNETNNKNNNTINSMVSQIGDYNMQKTFQIKLRLMNIEPNDINSNKLKSLVKRSKVRNRVKIIKLIKIIKFNSQNINLDLNKILLRILSSEENNENKLLYITSFISNIISFNSKYSYNDIFPLLLSKKIEINYNCTNIKIFSALNNNENVYITFLAKSAMIFIKDRGKMIVYNYPYGFIVSNILRNFNIIIL